MSHLKLVPTPETKTAQLKYADESIELGIKYIEAVSKIVAESKTNGAFPDHTGREQSLLFIRTTALPFALALERSLNPAIVKGAPIEHLAAALSPFIRELIEMVHDFINKSEKPPVA